MYWQHLTITLSTLHPLPRRCTGGIISIVTLSRLYRFPYGQVYWQHLTIALSTMYQFPTQVYWQRALSARTVFVAKALSIIGGFGCIIMAIPAALFGAIAFTAGGFILSSFLSFLLSVFLLFFLSFNFLYTFKFSCCSCCSFVCYVFASYSFVL